MNSDFIKDLEQQGIKRLLELVRNSSGRIKSLIEAIIRDKIKSKKYLISINEEEINKIYLITKTEIYRRMENCLGSHWSMNLIALGLYVAELNDLQKNEIVEKVRAEIHRKYRAEGIKILDMGSTRSISQVINYLSGIKIRKNYNFIQMCNLFDKIIEQWKDITIFVKSEDTTNKVSIVCQDMIASNKPIFFVFAFGNAVNHTIYAIAQLNVENKLKGYIFTSNMQNPREETGPNKKEVYSCMFESVNNFGIDIFV